MLKELGTVGQPSLNGTVAVKRAGIHSALIVWRDRDGCIAIRQQNDLNMLL